MTLFENLNHTVMFENLNHTRAIRRSQLFGNRLGGALRSRISAGVKNMQTKIYRFNASGKAVRTDALMYANAKDRAVARGRGQWKRWTPEAVTRMGFSRGTCRLMVQSLADSLAPTASGKHSASSVTCSRSLCARAIIGGQSQGLGELVGRSVEEAEFGFWLTGHCFDESKLWYIVKNKGYRNFSTLSWHSQVTWKDVAGIHDEDVVRPPQALRRYTAASQWNAMTDDPVAGILPHADARPKAKLYGTMTSSDSHRVNILMLKHLRATMPADHLLLPSFCLQHPVGTACTSITDYLNIFTRVWTLAKTFAEGDFHQDLVSHVSAVLEDEEYGLEVVDPDVFELEPDDLRCEFTQAIMDRCFVCGPSLGEESSEDHKKAGELKASFIEFFPYGWNRARPIHPCPAGCCGPTAKHDRSVSLKKAKDFTEKVVLKCITQPAKNKWTKMDPAMRQATIVVCFFKLVLMALESKLGVTYEDLTALGQEEAEATLGQDEAQPDQESYKGALKRFGK